MKTWPCRLQPKAQGACAVCPVNHVVKTKDHFIKLTIKSQSQGDAEGGFEKDYLDLFQIVSWFC